MKASLEFDFHEEDTLSDFINAVNSGRTHSGLFKLDQDLRSIVKFDKTELGHDKFESQEALLRLIRGRLGEIMGE